MSGESNLAALLRSMEPRLHAVEHGYGHLPPEQDLPPGLIAFAVVREAEGVSVVAPVDVLAWYGVDHLGGWARISLTVHSDLAAVGLTAAIAAALAGAGLSANVIAGYFHDHVLVPWSRRDDAMAALARLSAGS